MCNIAVSWSYCEDAAACVEASVLEVFKGTGFGGFDCVPKENSLAE